MKTSVTSSLSERWTVTKNWSNIFKTKVFQLQRVPSFKNRQNWQHSSWLQILQTSQVHIQERLRTRCYNKLQDSINKQIRVYLNFKQRHKTDCATGLLTWVAIGDKTRSMDFVWTKVENEEEAIANELSVNFRIKIRDSKETQYENIYFLQNLWEFWNWASGAVKNIDQR